MTESRLRLPQSLPATPAVRSEPSKSEGSGRTSWRVFFDRRISYPRGQSLSWNKQWEELPRRPITFVDGAA
eukprot:5083815-Pyramimonas_sp.AAC.1